MWTSKKDEQQKEGKALTPASGFSLSSLG